MGFDPGCCQCIYLLLFYHIHEMAYCGGSQDHGDLSYDVGQIWDYEGYLILIIALDSIYLNPYYDVSNRLSEGVSQACTDDSSTHNISEIPNIQGVIFNELWHNGVDLGPIIQESHASLPGDSYPGYDLNPIPFSQRSWDSGVDSVFGIYAFGVPSWGTFSGVTFPWGAQAPIFGAIPSFWFKCKSVLDATTSGQSWIE